MQNLIVTGSIAYDHLMTFDGRFSDSILPDQLDNLSVSFLASDHDVFFGGCGGNIAYNLSLLGAPPLLFAVLGGDFKKYFDWFDKNSISTDFIYVDNDKLTPSAYILTDNAHKQITFFSPSAMGNLEGCMSFDDINAEDVCCAIISPDLPKRMLALADSALEKGVPYIFDPGQQTVALKKTELAKIAENAIGIIVNSYEFELLLKKLEMNVSELLESVKFIVKTNGDKGAELYEGGDVQVFPVIQGLDLVDPTGCGDAFRAGFLFSYAKGDGLSDSCLSGNALASFAIASKGTQNHGFSLNDFEERLVMQRGL